MDDKQRAIEALQRAGYEPTPRPRGVDMWHRKVGDETKTIVVLGRDLGLRPNPLCFVLEGDLADLPALLSPLTVEMVQQAFQQLLNERAEQLTDDAYRGYYRAYDDLMRRLRQQIEQGGAHSG